jgi:hypothetical protein
MAIFDIFKSGSNSSQQSNQQSNQQSPAKVAEGGVSNQPSGVTTGMVDVAGNNNNNTQQQQSQQPANPLDAFSNLFNNTDTNTEKAPSFSLPEDTLSNVAKSQNFLQGIDEGTVQKAMSGDAKAFMDVIGAATQNAYKASLAHGSSLTDNFINSRLDYEGKSLSGKVKNELTNTELGASTQNFNHPVVKAQLTQVAQGLAKQHPDATPQQIAQMARDYVTTLANAINPNSTNKDSGGKTAADTNWGDYFG